MLRVIKLYFSRVKRHLDPQHLDKTLTTFSSLLLKVGIFVFIGFIVWGSLDKRYVLDPFHVPAEFRDQGYDGAVIAQEVRDKVLELTDIAILSQKEIEGEGDLLLAQEAQDSNLEQVLSVDIPGTALNVSSIIGIFKQVAGVRRKTISGDLTRIDSLLLMKVRVSGTPVVKYEELITRKSGLKAAYDTLIQKAAEHTLRSASSVKYLYYAYHKKQYPNAKAAANMILKKGVNKKYAYNILGMISRREKDYAQTMYYLNLAIKEDPYFSNPYNTMGLCLKEQKKYEEAIASFQKGVAVNPKDATALYNWGQTLATQDKQEAAIEKYKSAAALRPKAIYYRSWGLALKKMKKIPEAIELYRKSLSIDDTDFKTYNNLAGLYKSINNIDASINYANRSISLDSTYSFSYSTLAENYCKLGKDSLYYKNMELAFKNGYPIKNLNENENHRKHYEKREFQLLAAKYHYKLSANIVTNKSDDD